ncbi:MAG: hypothetical protein KKF27_21005 [Gammaproteobacteria bacterium]|nr:hypothetical protein [Gammaproteobacteria bacterium]MBU2685730.1 hypothetical protein [Gammaproteobacteria bacterium]
MDPSVGNPTVTTPSDNDAPASKPDASANWYDSDTYQPHVKGNEGHFQKYKSEDEFIKGGVEAMKLAGKRGQFNAEVPKKDDPKYSEKMTALYDALERPSKSDQYKIKTLEVPKELEGKIQFPDALKNKAMEIAAKHRLSQEALDELAALQQQAVIDNETNWLKQRTDAANKAEEELKKDKNYEEDFELVRRLLTSDPYPTLWEDLEVTEWGSSPSLFRLLRDVARERVAEGTMDVSSPQGKAPSGKSAAAETEIAEYRRLKAQWPHSPSIWGHLQAKYGELKN